MSGQSLQEMQLFLLIFLVGIKHMVYTLCFNYTIWYATFEALRYGAGHSSKRSLTLSSEDWTTAEVGGRWVVDQFHFNRISWFTARRLHVITNVTARLLPTTSSDRWPMPPCLGKRASSPRKTKRCCLGCFDDYHPDLDGLTVGRQTAWGALK